MQWLEKKNNNRAENKIIDHREDRKEEKTRLNANKEPISGRYGQKLLPPILFRRSLEIANKCKVGVVKAHDVDLNHAFDQKDSKNWWWRQKEVKQKETGSGSFICLKDEVILIK